MSQSDRRNPQRSSTGFVLLPAVNASSREAFISEPPTETLLKWTFGRGTVIWRIWPAVLLHTIFAAVVISVSLTTKVKFAIPNVMLTLLGVVIGFVISYRAMSGYDRYWQGRSYWSDIIRTSRTFGRLIWFHVPLKVSKEIKQAEEGSDEDARKKKKLREARRMMAEKRMALDLVEAFSVSTKHHLRGEIGLYYEDLYHLVRPLHHHTHHHQAKPQATNPSHPTHENGDHPDTICISPVLRPSENSDQAIPSESTHTVPENPVIPPINAYGTFPDTTDGRPSMHRSSTNISSSSGESVDDENQLLLPSRVRKQGGWFSKVSGDLIPFATFFGHVARLFVRAKERLFRKKDEDDLENGTPTPEDNGNTFVNAEDAQFQRRWAHSGRISAVGFTHAKHRPKIAGGGENTPLQVIRGLSQWLDVLEARGTVPGNALGGMYGCIWAFEDSLAGLERILTTPLPFVFSVHIRTVWIYLFFLPFQLVDQFGWYAIPGVAIASFIYLGFAAVGEEVEQPFGYDENDLDLDMFCREVIHADFEHLKKTPCMNVFLGSHHNAGNVILKDPQPGVVHGRVEEVFGSFS